MNKLYTIIFYLLVGIALWSCEDDIYPELEKVDPQIVVDAWINNKPEPQKVILSKTLPYYQAKKLPPISGAEVFIMDNEGKRYDFVEGEIAGEYIWSPTAEIPSFGKVGGQYGLTVLFDDVQLTAVSYMKRSAPIDSVTFRAEKESFILKDGYWANFYAKDPEGQGDSYWIKSYKNGVFLNKASEINIAYDAGFSSGSNVDGIQFIQPIRDAVNPIEADDEGDGKIFSPFSPGDSIYVEIYSITDETFNFMYQMALQTNRPGGFSELFATPLANVPSNIQSNLPGDKNRVIGFFNVSEVYGMGAYLDPDNLPVPK